MNHEIIEGAQPWLPERLLMNFSEHLLGASSSDSLRSARNSGFVC